ncbi:MAG: DUF2073 domain-containing protein [archaeon]
MLTLQFIPYREIEELNSAKRIAKLMKSVKEDKIVLLEGRLRNSEEAELIKKTMEEIDDKFKGIELSVLYPEAKNEAAFKRLRHRFINMLLGDRSGLTIIGPASIVKEIKQDPDKIQLLTEEASSGKKRKKK